MYIYICRFTIHSTKCLIINYGVFFVITHTFNKHTLKLC